MTDNSMNNLSLNARKALLEDSRTKEHEIEVQENDGVITLQGSVPSTAASKAAESILREFLGIEDLINELHIDVEKLDDSLKDTASSP